MAKGKDALEGTDDAELRAGNPYKQAKGHSGSAAPPPKRAGRYAKEGRNAAEATALRRYHESTSERRAGRRRMVLTVVVIATMVGAAGGLGYYYRDEILHPGKDTSPIDTITSPCGNLTLPSSGNPLACIDTSMGTIAVELYADKAPKTVDNFVTLAKKGYYDGLIFHRVIKDFMIQTGDPKGDGTGGPGYSIPDEFSPQLRHDRAGTLSMANSGPNTGGSQFFITVAATGWLDGYDNDGKLKICGNGVSCHAVFGRTLDQKSLDVVIAIDKVPTTNDKPNTTVTMRSVTIIE